MLNKYMEQYIEKYFAHGIENKPMLEYGLLFYVTRCIHREDSSPLVCIGIRKTRKERDIFKQQERKFIDIPPEERDEYYSKRRKEEDRLNDEARKWNLLQLEDRCIEMQKKYQQFIVLPDDVHSYRLELSPEHEKIIEEHVKITLKKLIQEQKLYQYPLGMYFNRNEEAIFAQNEWTQEVGEVLSYLIKLEKERPVEFQRKWIEIRLKRAENREPRINQEIENVKKIKEIFERKEREYKKQFQID